MRSTLIFVVVAALACARGEQPSPEAADAMGEATIEPTALQFFAGEWDGTVTSLPDGAIIATMDLTAAAEPAVWSMAIVNARDSSQRSTMIGRIVAAAGDSVIVETGPSPSVIRRGQRVSTRGVYRIRDDMMFGTIQATYPNGDTATMRSYAMRK